MRVCTTHILRNRGQGVVIGVLMMAMLSDIVGIIVGTRRLPHRCSIIRFIVHEPNHAVSSVFHALFPPLRWSLKHHSCVHMRVGRYTVVEHTCREPLKKEPKSGSGKRLVGFLGLRNVSCVQNKRFSKKYQRCIVECLKS